MEVERIRGWQDFQSLRKVGFQTLASGRSRNLFTHILAGWLFETVTRRHHLLNITYYFLVSDIFEFLKICWWDSIVLHKCFWSWGGMWLKWQECRICDEKLWNTVDNLKKETWDTKPPLSHHTFQISLRDLNLFHFTRSKKLSSITDLLIHSSFTSLLAMDSGNSNSSPENILSSGGNMRIFVKGILIFLRKMSVGSKNLCFSSDLHTGLRICPQNCSFILRCQEEAKRVGMILDYFDPNKQTEWKMHRLVWTLKINLNKILLSEMTILPYGLKLWKLLNVGLSPSFPPWHVLPMDFLRYRPKIIACTI